MEHYNATMLQRKIWINKINIVPLLKQTNKKNMKTTHKTYLIQVSKTTCQLYNVIGANQIKKFEQERAGKYISFLEEKNAIQYCHSAELSITAHYIIAQNKSKYHEYQIH